MSPERIWYGTDAAARLARLALAPLSGLYWLGWQGYLALYRLGLKKAKSPHKPVICIGNLVVGGSGKSPTTIHVAKVLRDLGFEVAISASGYGSSASESAAVAPTGDLQASQWGDEPAMIRWQLPDVPLVVGRNRVEAARICHELFPNAVLLMDDGLQHLPLKKQITLAIDDPSIANRLVLPGGPYREPRSNLARADGVISTVTAGAGPFSVVFRDAGLQQVSGDAAELQGDVAVLTAVARPERFLRTVERRGLGVAAQKFLADHDPLSAGNLFEGIPAQLPLLVTAKDWVKLRERSDLGNRKIYVAQLEARIEPEAAFRSWLQSKLHEQA